MIVEGVLTTRNVDNSTHLAAMGPVVDERLEHFLLRPYQTSTTFLNLARGGEAVFHVTDDVELLVRAALNLIHAPPTLRPAQCIDGQVIQSACRWYELRVESIDDRQLRAEITCKLVHQGSLREFLGFCRAKHAVLEAAILASRLKLLPLAEIQAEFEKYRTIVEKTAGDQERSAFELLCAYIQEASYDADSY